MASKQQLIGVKGRKDLWMLDPEHVRLATDPSDPLYDVRATYKPDAALIASILHQGVLEPIVVVKRGDELWCVDGRQRVLAACEANKQSTKQGGPEIRVPAVSRRSDPRGLLAIMVSTNEIRKDDGPLEKATKANKLLEAGYTEEELCMVFGVTPTTINNWLSLFEVDDNVIKAVKRGELSASAAAKLAKLPPEKQRQAVKTAKNGKGRTTVKSARAAAGPVRNRMRNRKEIVGALKRGKLPPGWVDALNWVLRQD